MKEIKYNSDFTMFCEIHEDGNMVDITDKCPIELCQNMNTILNGELVIDDSFKDEPVEDIYNYIVEKTYETPTWTQEVNFKDKPKEKLLIAFNKFFFNYIT